MTVPKILRIHLEDDLRKSAQAGQHNFLSLVRSVVEDAGFRVEFRGNGAAERQKAAARRGYALTHMKSPPNDRALTFRRVYHYPFWQIEAAAERWHWDVARAKFDAATVNAQLAGRFRDFWRKRLFGDVQAGSDGMIYVALQGRLLDHRSFQSCAPVDMVRATLAQAGDRPVVVALHPGETYSDRETRAIEHLVAQHSNARLVTGQMQMLLPRCACIVTQNSSVAFNGLFFDKPVILFGRVDFHHPCRTATPETMGDALKQALGSSPSHAAYLWWFWQENSINAGRPEAAENIRARLARFGWPV